MRYPVFVSDLDHSLRIPSDPLPAPTQSFLSDLVSNDGVWSLATGREAPNIRNIHPLPNRPWITESGGRIVRPVSGRFETLWCQPIEDAGIHNLGDVFGTQAVHFAGFMPVSAGGFYAFAANSEAARFAQGFYGDFLTRVTQSVAEFLRWLAEGTVKITLKILQEMDRVISCLPPAVEFVRSEGFLDLTGHVNKAIGLRKWAEITGADLKEIVFAGDSPNDIPVFEQLELGAKIQVGPGCPDLAQYATHYTESPATLGATLRQVFDLPPAATALSRVPSVSRRSTLSY